MGYDFDAPARVLVFPKLRDGLSQTTVYNLMMKVYANIRVPKAKHLSVAMDLGNTPGPHQWTNNEFVIIADFESLGETSDPETWKYAEEILKPYLLTNTSTGPLGPFGRNPFYITVT